VELNDHTKEDLTRYEHCVVILISGFYPSGSCVGTVDSFSHAPKRRVDHYAGESVSVPCFVDPNVDFSEGGC